MQGSEAARWYRERQKEAAALAERYEQVAKGVEESLAKVVEEEGAARLALATAYLGELSPAALARAASLTSFKGFVRRDPLKAMGLEEKALQRRIQEIRADERYHRRQWLVGPEGELTRSRAEAAELLEPWEHGCKRYEDLTGFEELLAVNYDTPEFATGWWEPAYWRQWAAGDRICEELGVGDFGDDVLPEYRRLEAERTRWREELARWDARIAEVHGLTQEHDKAVARIPDLPRIYLESTQKVLADFLTHADAALLAEWCKAEAEPDREVLMGLQRMGGARAKREMLTELLDQGVRAQAKGFKARSLKYAQKAAKYARPKHARRTLGAREIDVGFTQKRDKYLSNADKVDRVVQRIVIYDDYGRFDLANEPELWWLEMTGRPPGSLTPRLNTWYQRRSGVSVRHDPTWHEHAKARAISSATVAAAQAPDDPGYLS